MPGPLDDIARRLPQSQPGTIFGIPVARLRDADLQKKILFIAGVALIASILVPFHLSPTIFAWSSGMPKFDMLIWPIIAGGVYLLLTAAPPHMREKIPPMALHWAPFVIAYTGIFISKMGFGGMGGGGMGGAGSLYIMGYTTLVFGLLARITAPQDQYARYIIAAGAAMLIVPFFDGFDFFFKFSHMPFLFIIHNILWFLIFLVAILCIAFVVPAGKLPAALQPVEQLAPVIAAVLILWLPLQQVLMALIFIVHMHAGVGAVLNLAHGLLPLIAYFAVLMMAAPAAYEEAMKMIRGGGGQPPQGGGQPPQGGGYPPPQGGGYPPQGGGYPPQGGGWPQQ